jgi:hypothetical protein
MRVIKLKRISWEKRIHLAVEKVRRKGITKLEHGLRSNELYEQVGPYMPRELKHRVKIACLQQDISSSDVWTSLLKAWISTFEGEYISFIRKNSTIAKPSIKYLSLRNTSA